MSNYRDELKKRDPGRVSATAIGGAFGCPGDYFHGAPVYEKVVCSPIKEQRCRRCWDAPYIGERWIADD